MCEDVTAAAAVCVCVSSALFCSSLDLLTHPVAVGSQAEIVFNGNLGF